MAQINRYTSYTPARYKPRTLQELMMAPAYMREQHDAVSAAIAETEGEIAKADAADIHDPLLRERQKLLYDKLQGHSDKLESEGFSPSSKSDFLRFNKEYQTEMGPSGMIGRIDQARVALDAEKTAYLENATTMGYSPEAAGSNWNDWVTRYGDTFAETGQVTNIDSLYAPLYKDPVGELKGLLDKAGVSATDVSNFGSKIITDDPNNPGHYILTGGARRAYSDNINQLQAAVDYINNQIQDPNSDIGKSLIHQRKTVDDVLNEVSGIAEVYRKTSTITDDKAQISGYKSASELGMSPIPGELSYETQAATTVNLKEEGVLKSITSQIEATKNLTEGPMSLAEATKKDIDTAFGAQTDSSTGDQKDVDIFEDMFKNEEEAQEYKDLYKQMQYSNVALEDVPYNSLEALETVQTYLLGNKGNIRQNIIITDDYMTTYGDQAIGVNKTDKTKIGEAVKTNRDTRMYGIDGEIYAYKDLPGKYGKKEVIDNMTYVGYMSPKNHLVNDFTDGESYASMFASPLLFRHIKDDGEPVDIYVSRSAGERDTKSHRALTDINTVFRNTDRYPKVYFPIPEGEGAEIAYFPDGVDVPGVPADKKYILTDANPTGFHAPKYLSESDVEDMYYNGYGVMSEVDRKRYNKKVNK